MERQAVAKVQKSPARSDHIQRQSARSPVQSSSAAHPLQDLQRSIGNQAVQRLIRSPYIQTKLQVSTPGDPFEQEADRVADTVMRMPAPASTDENANRIQAKPLATQITPLVQRESEPLEEEEKEEAVATKPVVQRVPLAVRDDDDEEKVSRFSERSQVPSYSGACSIQRLCTSCEAERQGADGDSGEMVHRKATPEQRADDDDVDEQRVQTKEGQAATPKVTTSVAANVHALRGGGSALPPATRAFFEPRFGADFSHVRLHTDSRAAATTNSIQARAFTVGPNIAFGAGQYAPHSHAGRQLLAHELTHVVQQNGPSRSSAARPPCCTRSGISSLARYRRRSVREGSRC